GTVGIGRLVIRGASKVAALAADHPPSSGKGIGVGWCPSAVSIGERSSEANCLVDAFVFCALRARRKFRDSKIEISVYGPGAFSPELVVEQPDPRRHSEHWKHRCFCESLRQPFTRDFRIHSRVGDSLI